MKKLLVFILTFICFKSFSQSTVPLRGDTIRVYKQGGDAVLKVEGHLMLKDFRQGNSNDSVLTWDATTLKVRMVNRSSVGGGGSGTDNTNLGSFYRLLVPSSQGIKGIAPGYGTLWDSTTNANSLTSKVDSFSVATRARVKQVADSLGALIGVGGSSFSFDSLSMISITSYPGVSVQWTTGTITSGSPTLTVADAKDFAIGQWVTVEGAGASGVNLRTTITNVVGTTITLNNNAGTSVTSARFRHDCTPGIQMALNDAVLDVKKQNVYVPSDTATYVLSGPLVTSVDGVNPNSQLYIPKVEASGKMVTLRILGSTPPNMATEGTAAAPRNTQGCIFESTLTTEASGTEPAVLGTSFYNAGIVGFKNYINTIIENLIIRTNTKNPAGTDIGGTMSGIQFKKMTQKYFDNVKIDITSALVDRVDFTDITIGIYSPEVNNKAQIGNGNIFVEGYYYGHVPGEHELTDYYIGLANHYDIGVGSNYYNIFYTKYTGELNAVNIYLNGTSNIGIASYETEHGVGDFPFEADIKQNSGTSRVHIWTSIVSQSGTGPGPGITIITSGSPDYSIDHGEGQNRFAAKLADIALYPTDSLTGYWPLDNEVGDFPDTSGTGFDLARVNGTTTVASKIEGGANFVSSSTQTLTGTTDNRLSASASGLTIGGWFRIATGTTGLRGLFSKWDNSGDAEWTLYWASSNNAVHFAASSDGTAFVDVFNASGTILADDSWHFLVGVWDGTDAKIYIDNVEWASLALATLFNTGTAAIGVGNYPYGAGTTFDGGADELFVYRKALSDEQLTLLYNSGVGKHYLEGSNYDIIDTTSSRLILNRLRLTHGVGANNSVAYFDYKGEIHRSTGTSKISILDSVYLSNAVPYNSGAGIVHLGIDTVAGSPTFGKLVRKTAGGSTPTLQQALTAGSTLTGDNTIINDANTLTITGNTVAGDNIFEITSTSTAAASNSQRGLSISLSGANSNSGQTTRGANISNTHTGTTATNVGLSADASGAATTNYAIMGQSLASGGTTNIAGYFSAASATNNYGILVNGGNSGFGTLTPTMKLQVNGSFVSQRGSTVAAANDLTLQAFNSQHISGNTQINAITSTGWVTGSMVLLIFDSNPLVKNNTSGGGGTAPILLAGGVDFSATANDVLVLFWDGANWYEVSRSVN